MGNDQSHLAGINIEDKAVEVADFWSQHSASVPKSDQLSNLTIFIGELFVSGPLWTIHTPLEKCSKVREYNFVKFNYDENGFFRV